jgi:tripartite-type tricarboxylate transporter receptor subunit TctC
LLLAALFTASSVAHAQYPTRPVLLVVPYTAGSDADLAARNLAIHASRHLGQTVVVMNQPGASGAIGTLAVRNATPDGYRLLLSRIASQVILPRYDSKTPYKPNDFTMLSVLEINPYVCATKSDAPYASMKELIAAIRKNPGKLNFATVGEGTLQNFGPQYLFSLVGLPKDAAGRHSVQGSGELTAALVGGHVQFACSNLGALLGQFRAGTLRPLMTTTREPLKELARRTHCARARLAGDGKTRCMVRTCRAAEAAARGCRTLERCAGGARARSGVARRQRKARRHTCGAQSSRDRQVCARAVSTLRAARGETRLEAVSSCKRSHVDGG